ncbi:MAG: rod shape-determining protein MreD [Saccharospirillum sp.]|jgi:rod shape-determining protein MreD
MRAKPANALWVVALSFFVAYVLATVPLPQVFALARPDWVGLCLIFWVLILPERIGVFVAFFIGILQDVLMGTFLGTFAFAYSVLAYLVLILHQRLRMYPLLQQALVVFMFIALGQVLVQWTKELFGNGLTGEMHLLPSVVSAFLWPWIFVMLRALQIRFRVQ